MKIHRQGGF